MHLYSNNPLWKANKSSHELTFCCNNHPIYPFPFKAMLLGSLCYILNWFALPLCFKIFYFLGFHDTSFSLLRFSGHSFSIFFTSFFSSSLNTGRIQASLLGPMIFSFECFSWTRSPHPMVSTTARMAMTSKIRYSTQTPLLSSRSKLLTAFCMSPVAWSKCYPNQAHFSKCVTHLGRHVIMQSDTDSRLLPFLSLPLLSPPFINH